MCQNIALSANTVAKNMLKSFSRNLGETELHLLRNLLYAQAFVDCTNWLLKFTPVANVTKLYTVVSYNFS
jgi:hypothetical protein